MCKRKLYHILLPVGLILFLFQVRNIGNYILKFSDVVSEQHIFINKLLFIYLKLLLDLTVNKIYESKKVHSYMQRVVYVLVQHYTV